MTVPEHTICVTFHVAGRFKWRYTKQMSLPSYGLSPVVISQVRKGDYRAIYLDRYNRYIAVWRPWWTRAGQRRRGSREREARSGIPTLPPRRRASRPASPPALVLNLYPWPLCAHIEASEYLFLAGLTEGKISKYSYQHPASENTWG